MTMIKKTHAILSYILSDHFSKELKQGYHFKLGDCEPKAYQEVFNNENSHIWLKNDNVFNVNVRFVLAMTLKKFFN